ncbi:ATP-binding protein [Acinetobacter sp. WCHAc060033]|uniref:ATP-binding protein n=1 Tax=Acinetobacter sp. WCHAc060033 TaxID=2518624 RepID=UPI0013EE8AA0|nr:ATP-binding protein [Acinetobacter sp. WCHAc060033]
MKLITQFNFDEKHINILPNKNFDESNVFTVVIGQNSIGKSRLLGSIIKDNLDENSVSNKKIIAITNTSYNKFPKNQENFPNYTKLLPLPTNESIGGFGIRINEQYFENIINEFINYKQNNKLNTKFRSNIYMDVKRLTPKLLLKIKENSQFTYNKLAQVLNFLKLDNSLIIRLVVRKNILEDIKNLKGDYIEIINKLESINSLEISLEDLAYLDPVIIDLILLKVIDIFRIYLYDNKINKRLNYRELSSGQLAILSMGLALICELENESLICIDEPEVNLHPQWQEEIINLIESISENYQNCQFLIATHSPQIVSNLTCKNSFILNLNTNELQNNEQIMNRSADFQLTEVFSAPGNNNEYLLRKILIILNKLNTNMLLSEDENHTKELVKKLYYEEKFQEHDKVKTLIEVLLDLEEKQ